MIMEKKKKRNHSRRRRRRVWTILFRTGRAAK